jgi:hypothetical protein
MLNMTGRRYESRISVTITSDSQTHSGRRFTNSCKQYFSISSRYAYPCCFYCQLFSVLSLVGNSTALTHHTLCLHPLCFTLPTVPSRRNKRKVLLNGARYSHILYITSTQLKQETSLGLSTYPNYLNYSRFPVCYVSTILF